jgi:hypothetical protein
MCRDYFLLESQSTSILTLTRQDDGYVMGQRQTVQRSRVFAAIEHGLRHNIPFNH